MPEELTPRQAEILAHIQRRIAADLPVSYRELAKDMGIKNSSGIKDYMKSLARKGHIMFDPGNSEGVVRLLKADGTPVPGTLVESVGLLGKAKLTPANAEDVVGAGENVFRVESDNLKHSGVRRGDFVVKDAEGKIVAVARRLG